MTAIRLASILPSRISGSLHKVLLLAISIENTVQSGESSIKIGVAVPEISVHKRTEYILFIVTGVGWVKVLNIFPYYSRA